MGAPGCGEGGGGRWWGAWADGRADRNQVGFGREGGGVLGGREGGDGWSRVDDRLLWDGNADVQDSGVLGNRGQKVRVV
ncbi:hypothetical protein B1218_34865, partial [Pseudomonas ogarae]